MPCIAHLVIIYFGQIVGAVEAERADVKAADCTQQCIGCNYAVALRENLARACGGEILLRIEDIERVVTVFKDGVGWDAAALVASVNGFVGLR